MMTLSELREELMNDYGITAKWVETGGGQYALEVRLDDNTWGYVGSNEFEFVNELNTRVSRANLSIDEDGSNYEYIEDLPIERMARENSSRHACQDGHIEPVTYWIIVS
jgi:hypothetical protein